MNKYKCKHCGKIVKRDSEKKWIKSYCEKTGKTVHIQIVKTKTKMSKEQTPIGYLFNGRFYKTIEDLRGKTMSEDNQPQPLFTESQSKAKVLEALEREFKNYENNNPHKGHIEYYETEVKPKYK